MKVFFDTNVYVAEALLGEAATAMILATESAGWRIFCSEYVLDELVRGGLRIVSMTAYYELPADRGLLQ